MANNIRRLKFRLWRDKAATKLGLAGKTPWDFVQLLMIPIALAIAAIWFDRSAQIRSEAIEATRISEQRFIENDRAAQNILQNYFISMAELLTEKNLREASRGSEVQSLARSITLASLRSLDSERKGLLIQFLYESELISDRRVILLEDADLSGAYLSGAHLSRAFLFKTNLSGANLSGADLFEANLSRTDLSGANLSGADLSGANLIDADLSKVDLTAAGLSRALLFKAKLSGADLTGARLSGAALSGAILTGADLSEAFVTYEQLSRAKSLKDAIMPDGQKFDPAIHQLQSSSP